MPAGKRATTLSPLHYRKEANTLRLEPGILLACGKTDIGFCPAARPEVFFPVKSRTPHPVLQGKIVGISYPQASLLQGVDQEETSKGPERLPTQ